MQQKLCFLDLIHSESVSLPIFVFNNYSEINLNSMFIWHVLITTDLNQMKYSLNNHMYISSNFRISSPNTNWSTQLSCLAPPSPQKIINLPAAKQVHQQQQSRWIRSQQLWQLWRQWQHHTRPPLRPDRSRLSSLAIGHINPQQLESCMLLHSRDQILLIRMTWSPWISRGSLSGWPINGSRPVINQ